MENLSDKFFSTLDSVNEESRTEHKHRSLPQKKFEPKYRRQEDSLSSATAPTKQENSKKKNSTVESTVRSGMSSKFKVVKAPNCSDISESPPGSSSALLLDDSRRDNVDRLRSRGQLTHSTKRNVRVSAKHSDETSSFTSIKGTGYKFLENLLEKDPMDVVIKLASSKIGFTEFLKKDLSPDLILLTVKILAEKVCVVGFQHNKTTVLIAACQPHFLNKLEIQINKIPTEQQSRKSKILPFLENLLIFYETVVNMLPQTACEKFKNLFVMTELSIEGAERYQKIKCGDIKKKFQCLNTQLKSMIEENERSSITQSSKMEQLQYLQPPDNFRCYSIFPTAEDFASKPFLRPSIIKGAYIDVEHYLDVQFRLLREDFVGPLREGISQYMEHCLQGQKRFKRIDNVRIYHDALFLHTVTIKEKVGVLLKFDTKNKLRNVLWENSKRFMFGSLLCFTHDNFGTFFFGTVLERDRKQLENGCVVVELIDEIDTTIFSRSFTVAESEIYFEPYRQVLNALQTMPFAAFPMKSYIVHGVTEVGLPLYLCTKSESVIYNIGEFNVNVTEMDAWPKQDELKLDSSQYKSFRTALTREFVIIQGPPGTGKTFLGLKILKTFLDNQNIWNTDGRPILVVCYTNHALDQVLEGTLKYTTNIIRIGGQSQSETLVKYNLKEARRRHPRRVSAASSREIFLEMGDIISHINSLHKTLEKIAENNGVISISSLKEMGIAAKQLESLKFDDLLTDEVFIEWLKGDGTENPDNLFQPGDANAVPEDLPFENKNAGDNAVEYEEEDDDYGSINVFNDEYGLVIPTIDRIQLQYALDLSHLGRDVQHYKKLMKSCGENIEDYVKYQQMWLYIMDLYRFFKNYLTQDVNMNKQVVERLTNVDNLWELQTAERWYLYKHWCRCLHSTLTKRVLQLQAKYKQLCMRYDEIRDSMDLQIMRKAIVVGMTTTGAARKQSLLQELKPRIVIVEEAAEVLESHVVVSLTKACEHLILIGDHKQLRPSTAVYELGKKFNLDVSLFERMLHNGMHYDCLENQHRMRPDIANLITPTIYPTLISAPSVFQYENVKGVAKNLFFIDHRFNEEEVSEIVSRRNLFEAQFLIAFCRYLLLQGYEETDITILTTYSGQMFYMRKLKKESGALRNVKITVVDNFQGEENKIILLSLVRSNEDAKIGFLKVENRVCVALSRAKEGFYIIGNMDNLTKSSKIWQEINATLMKQDAIGSHLTLRCQNHPSEKTKVALASDFEAVPQGGCSLPCATELPCGHKCQSVCHIQNRYHEKNNCSFPCQRVPEKCPLGHKCLKKCFQDCGDCKTSVEKVLPCQHVVTIACHVDVAEYRCREVVEAVLEPCKHNTKKLCFQDVENVPCPFPCEDRLLCGHSCTENCHARNDPDHLEYKCEKQCEKNNSGCKMNHKCNKLCYEDCGKCAVEIEVQLSCGHTHKIRCSSDPSEVKCDRDCKRTMACGHVCRRKCFQPCEGCPKMVQKVIPDCGHKVYIRCSEEPNRSMCKKTCERLLPCGHHCTSLCGRSCISQCKELVPSHITPTCGHAVEIPCYLTRTELRPYSEELLSRCKTPCGKTLECGHQCSGTCSECLQGHLHLPCKEKCARVQICGHSCNAACAKTCPPCYEDCDYQCRHSRCRLKCGVPCLPCKKRCAWRCKHLQCTKLCYEICNREPCYEPCEKKRRCGHYCIGFCGDPCPPLCRICNKEKLTATSFGSGDDARFVYLVDCKHTIESKALDEWLKQKDDAVCLKSCPLCKTPIKRTLRFLNYLKISYMHFNNVKERMFGNSKENIAKKLQLYTALNKMDIPYEVKLASSEIRKMLDLLQSNLQPQNTKMRIFLSRKDLDSLSIKIDFFTKLLEPLENFVHKGHIYGGSSITRLLTGYTSASYEDYLIYVMKQFDILVSLMRTRNINISQQEVIDFTLEINRFVRLVELVTIEMTMGSTSLNFEVITDLHKKAVEEVNSVEIFTPLQDQKVKEILKKLIEACKANRTLDNETVRRGREKAAGVRRGHWFRCPNGHSFVIGNHRGAVHERKCPYCRAKIVDSTCIA